MIYALVTLTTLALASTAHAQLSCGGALEFPGSPACKEYTGSNWTVALAEADCPNIPSASGGEVLQELCPTDGNVGVCTVDDPEVGFLFYFYAGDDATLDGACSAFFAGVWTSNAPLGFCNHNAEPAPGEALVSACKQYSGDGWDATSATTDCGTLDSGAFTADSACADSAIGYCVFNDGTANEYEIHYYEGDATALETGCTGLSGTWVESTIEVDILLQEAIDALVSDGDVTVSPDSCDETCVATLVATSAAIEFTPAGTTPTKGFIFLPGGVDPRSYSVAARMIAEAGFFVALLPFPDNLPFLDPFRPNNIILNHPEITNWAIGGHSLGGSVAGIYADVNPLGAIEALAFFASVTGDTVDLSDNALRVYALAGTEDLGLPVTAWEDSFVRLPANAYGGLIQGANHEQFAYYSRSLDAGEEPFITRERQHEIYVGATIHMLLHLGEDVTADFELPLYENLGLGDNADDICVLSQFEIASVSWWDLAPGDIDLVNFETSVEFDALQAEYTAAGGDSVVTLSTYTVQTSNPDDITSPPINIGEVWCKMKSQGAFVQDLNFTAWGGQGDCASTNERILTLALWLVPHTTRIKYFRSRTHVEFVDDVLTTSAAEFASTDIAINEVSGDYEISTPYLETPSFGPPPPFNGMFWCKHWTVASAVEFIYQIAEN